MDNTLIQQALETQIQGQSQAQVAQETKVNYCLYARKSTESEERQVLSIDSQIKEMLDLAERENLNIVTIKRESHSAKETGKRPIFNEIIEEIQQGKFNGILTWAPDRISRNAGDLGKIVDLMDAKLLQEIRTYGQRFTNSPNEKFLLMILGSQAKLENDNRGVNVKRGLRTRCEMGLWPTCPPSGYLTDKSVERKGHIIIDPERGPIIRKIFKKVAHEKWSGRKVYHWLRFDLNFKTKGNKNLSLSNIYLILQNTFYYGPFEYPRGSGNWYQGNHEPLVTKELFDLALEQLKRDRIVRESKEFAFTKLITCGHCGSGMTADEKYKKLKNGNTVKYIYYGCTRSRDHNCKAGYIREEELVSQLARIIDQLDINEIGVKKQFEEELERYSKFRQIVLQMNGKETEVSKEKKIDLRTYAKYILKQGNITEKREILTCTKSRLIFKDKKINLEKNETAVKAE